jgi:hypothetical protein
MKTEICAENFYDPLCHQICPYMCKQSSFFSVNNSFREHFYIFSDRSDHKFFAQMAQENVI